ncbi:hypothetical protein ACFL1E_04385 [Candidatus Omnitrophota bacterium]
MNNRILGIITFVFAYLLLPLVFSVSVSFYVQIDAVDAAVKQRLFFGVFSFLLLHLFIWEPLAVYEKGQRVIAAACGFLPFLSRVASLCLPLYTIFFLGLLISLAKLKIYNSLLVFLVGFSFMFHLVFTAKELKSDQTDFMFARYFFYLELTYLITIFLVALVFHFVFKGFSFFDFYRLGITLGKDVYSAVAGQLFFVR